MLLAALGLAAAWALPVPVPPAQVQPRFPAQQVAYHDAKTLISVADLVVGDLDGDGRADVVVPTYLGPVHVFLAYPSGGLRGPLVQDAVGERNLALGDLDEDGYLDLVRRFAGQTVWLGGDGAGGFRPAQLVGPAIDSPHFEILDLDLDGHLDVLAVSTFAVQVHLSDGTGRFDPLSPIAIHGDVTRDFAAGDVNGDGLPDVVVRYDVLQYQCASLLNLGGGVLAPAAPFQAGGSQGCELDLGDLDLDGDLDLVACTLDSFGVSQGNGDGTFQAPVWTFNPNSDSIQICDWNADGLLDLVIGGGPQSPLTVSWAAGNGTGGFGPVERLPSGIASAVRAAADVNGDGHVDIVAGQVSGQLDGISFDTFEKVSVLLGDGAGSVIGRRETAMSNPPFWRAIGDANGDGIVDVARGVLGSPNRVRLSFGDGTGGFGAPIDYVLPIFIDSIELGDVDGDGLGDLVCFHESGPSKPVVTLRGDGRGGFAAPVSDTVPGMGSLELVDFDGDGRADLGSGSSGFFFMSLGQPDGTFATQTPVFGLAATVGKELFADLNCDGHMDVLTGPVVDGSGKFSNYGIGIGDGNGGLASIGNRQIPHAVESAALGDLDGDGDPDLAFGRENGHAGAYYDVGVALNDGSGQFGPTRLVDVGAMPKVFGVADLDADGRGELIAWCYTGTLVWISIEDPKHTLHKSFAVSHRHNGMGRGFPLAFPIGVGHANLDGRPDLIFVFEKGVATHFNLGP